MTDEPKPKSLEDLLNAPFPEEEEFEPQEWKLLFMLVAENRAGLDLGGALTPYGRYLLGSVQRKLGIKVVGVDAGLGQMPQEYLTCGGCGQPRLYKAPDYPGV